MTAPLQIYRALGRDDYELCHTAKADDQETVVVLIDGTPQTSSWDPIEMDVCKRDMGRRLKRSDSPWGHDNALVFRPRAVQALGPILRACGELLPLTSNDGELWMFNPRALSGALDEAASEIVRHDSGTIARIRRPVFHPDVVRGVHAFKIPTRASPTFLAQRFVDAWHAAGLEGLAFTLEWTESDAAHAGRAEQP